MSLKIFETKRGNDRLFTDSSPCADILGEPAAAEYYRKAAELNPLENRDDAETATLHRYKPT
jgi:hypothetical protein